MGRILLEGHEYLINKDSALDGPEPAFVSTQGVMRIGRAHTREAVTPSSNEASRRAWEQHKPVICA